MENSEIEQSEPMRNLLDKFKKQSADSEEIEKTQTEAATNDNAENEADGKQNTKETDDGAKKQAKNHNDDESKQSEDQKADNEADKQQADQQNSSLDKEKEKTTSAVDKLEKSLRESQKWGLTCKRGR